MILMTLIFSFGLFLLFSLWRVSVKQRQLSLPTWQEIAGKLQPTQNTGIAALAQDFLVPGKARLGRTPEETWEMVGGVEGLKRMKQNTDVLLALASYAQRWNPEESVIVAERMRRDAMNLRRAIVGLGLGMTCGYGQARVLSYVHEAASSYNLMRERLLALYKNSHEGILPALESVV